MFFMITAFLFYSKLLDARAKSMDWIALYVSRIRRIMPLYTFAILVLFLVVACASHFTLHEYPWQILIEFFQWMLFIETTVNNYRITIEIVAGVIWSLTFEWLFYCSLAWVGKTIFRIRTPVSILIVTGLLFALFLVIILYNYTYDLGQRTSAFAGGIAAAFLVRNDKVKKFCSRVWASCILVVLIPAILLFYPNIGSPVPFVGLSLAFIIIAAGNNIFGLLTHRLLRYLGMISYSVYLLHGLVLFICFRFAIGLKKAWRLSPLEHWLVIGCCAISLILLCTLTYLYIEKHYLHKKANIQGSPKEVIPNQAVS